MKRMQLLSAKKKILAIIIVLFLVYAWLYFRAVNRECEDCVKKVVDKFLVEHPVLHSTFLAQDDFVNPKVPDLSPEASSMRELLMECMVTTPTTKLPLYEKLINEERWWSKDASFCGRPSFHIFRREQIVSKVFYCLGKAVPDMNSFLDTWISFGGSALMFGAGMKDSGNKKKRVFGFEIDADRAGASQTLLRGYPIEVMHDTSLIPNTYNGKDISSVKGNMVELCKSKTFDGGFVDGYGTNFVNSNGKTESGQEFYTLRDLCKVKYFVTFNLHQGHIYNFVEETKKSGEYEEFISGGSKGLGCYPESHDLRRFIILRRKN